MDDRVNVRVFVEHTAHEILVRQIALIELRRGIDSGTVSRHQAVNHDDLLFASFNETVNHM